MKMILRNVIVITILIFFLQSCIKPYAPNITKYENVFVVDGELTNLPGPYKVKLSRSFKFDENKGAPVSGAHVKILDNTGQEIELKEISGGTYSTIDSTFRGVIGNSYKLQILLNNEIYESDFETLKRPIPIDNIYWEYQQPDAKNNGIQLYLDTHDSTNNTHYYSWDYDETWKFRVPIDYVGKPEWKECYKDSKSTQFNIGSSTHRVGDNIDRRKLLYIGENTNRLFIRYTMNVRQFALPEKAYNFFNDLITLNQNQGTLFDPIPYSLVGNMKNLTHQDMPILGYFLVAGASEKRIFIDRSDLPKSFRPTDGFDDCSTADIEVPWKYKNDVRMYAPVDSLMRLGFAVMQRFTSCLPEQPGNPFSPCSKTDSLLTLYMAKPHCYNCTLNGTNKVPAFWKEKDSK